MALTLYQQIVTHLVKLVEPAVSSLQLPLSGQQPAWLVCSILQLHTRHSVQMTVCATRDINALAVIQTPTISPEFNVCNVLPILIALPKHRKILVARIVSLSPAALQFQPANATLVILARTGRVANAGLITIVSLIPALQLHATAIRLQMAFWDLQINHFVSVFQECLTTV